ncbi:hypothetical protein H6P81_016055 [Aristolochia fimbriata]|uniref:Uncharacterized protein n=1 Tax=Aristolochia fimbriata TaxID=158543 RepID=A0AAV7E9C0_ARIFI|nr:hypothetical protein H6P81_016055 [Aristolochia fimbriata]
MAGFTYGPLWGRPEALFRRLRLAARQPLRLPWAATWDAPAGGYSQVASAWPVGGRAMDRLSAGPDGRPAASVLGAGEDLCLCRRRESASAFLGVSLSALWPRRPSRACRPRRAPASPPSLGPKDDRPAGLLGWDGTATPCPSGEPRRSTLLFSLMCLGPTARAREGRDESVRHGAEFSGSWQQGHSPLTIPRRVFKSPKAIQIAAGLELCFVCPPPTSSPPRGPPRHAPLGSRKAPNVGRQAGARGGAGSSLDSDLEALSHNPTHGRADIKGSKSNAAMNAYCHKPLIPVMCRPSQTPHLTMSSAGSASPRRALNQKEGQCPGSTNGIKITFAEHPQGPSQCFVLIKRAGFPLSVPVLSRLVRRRGRPQRGVRVRPPPQDATTSSRPAGAARAVHRQPTGSGSGPRAQPSSQSFSPGYGSILPTSLAYIVPSTAGCSPWRPDAVMSTTRRGRHSGPPDFKGRPGDRHHATRRGALPAAGPYLRLSRFQGGQAICTDGRSAQAQGPGFGQPPALPTHRGLAVAPTGGYGSRLKAHPFSGLVDSAGRVEWGASWPTPRAAAGAAQGTSAEVATPPSLGLRDDDPLAGSSARACRLATRQPVDASNPAADRLSPSRDNDRYDRPPHPLPSRQFQALFDSLFKPWAGIYRPIWAAFPNNPTSPDNAEGHRSRVTTGGCHPLWPHSMGLAPSVMRDAFCRLHFERAKSRRFSYLGSSPFAAHTRGILRVFPPDLGSHPSKASRVTEATAGRGPLRARGSTHFHFATQGQGGRSHHCRGRRPWGKVFFSQPRQGGKDDHLLAPTTHPPPPGGSRARGGENTPGVDAQTRWFAGFCNSHQASHFATFFIDRESQDIRCRVVLGYRVRGGPPRPRQRGTASRFLFAWHRSPRVVVRVFASPTVAGADAESVGAGR